MARISSIVSKQEQMVFSEKESSLFLNKFLLLLILIVLLSSYIIIDGYNRVDELTNSYLGHKDFPSLGSIEREINGNSVNLLIAEDDFSELSPIDFTGINLHKSVSDKKENATSTKIVKNKQIIDESSEVKKHIKNAKKHVLITSSYNPKSLSFIKKKFYATNNIYLAIKLAKRFYSAKKYKEALKWSLISNEINSKNEDSWILFAKSKVKMGRKQDAINALSAYLKHSRSKKASILLKKLQKSV